MTGVNGTVLEELYLSEEELKSIEWLGDNWWLLGIVASHFQIAVESLTPEFYNQDDNDSLWHWWRRIGKYLGKAESVDHGTFTKEMRDGKSTLEYTTATEIWKATKNYLLEILEKGKKGAALPSWWSQLQKIYDPPLYEISQMVTFNRE